jgi:hypothetical protein
VKPDPVLRSLERVPEDDEPVTEEEHAAIEEGLHELYQGKGISTDELIRRL